MFKRLMLPALAALGLLSGCVYDPYYGGPYGAAPVVVGPPVVVARPYYGYGYGYGYHSYYRGPGWGPGYGYGHHHW